MRRPSRNQLKRLARPKGDAIEDCKQQKTFGKLVVLPIT
jgi:hypothetical protein